MENNGNEKMDQLIALVENQNKLISHLGLIVARISSLILALIVLFIIFGLLIIVF